MYNMCVVGLVWDGDQIKYMYMCHGYMYMYMLWVMIDRL